MAENTERYQVVCRWLVDGVEWYERICSRNLTLTQAERAAAYLQVTYPAADQEHIVVKQEGRPQHSV